MKPAERAARALCAFAGKPEDDIFEGAPMWRVYLPQVRAVLDAILEPSDGMKEAGSEIFRHYAENMSDMARESDAANVWRYMLATMHKEAE